MQLQFFINNLIVMHNYVRVSGGVLIPGRFLKSLQAVIDGAWIADGKFNLPTPMSQTNCGFEVSFCGPIASSEAIDLNLLKLIFQFEDGEVFQLTGTEAEAFYHAIEHKQNSAHRDFFERLQKPGYDRVLEIGSRARSGIVRRNQFPGKQYTGLDILEGENVDTVGDAHCLSEYFAPESFDVVFSMSTFEHLAMPWKVAIELNKVMRVGSVAFFLTHQALGMHDVPWDFWRFSNTAWDCLFNEYTGFRVVNTFLGGPMTLVPNVFRDHWRGFERATCFAESAVMVEKTGPCSLEWNVDVRRAIRGIYPS